MLQATEFLRLMRFITKSHEACIQTICREHRLTMMEATIITFLRNNPSVDTAADIAELRMLSKGNVSLAVESLIQKGLLKREQDGADRRRIHLHPTPAAAPIMVSLEDVRVQFQNEVFSGFSPHDLEVLDRINRRIAENTTNAMARRDGA